MGKLRTVNSLKDLSGKTVLLRIDSDVDIENGRILDDTRLASSLPTIESLLKKGANANMIGHLGRPETQFPIKTEKEFSLEPIARWFENKLKGRMEIIKIGEFEGWKITDRINLIENIRFFKGEEENPSTSSGQAFARELALLGDIFVNDAFAVSHRAHASIVGVAKFLPSYAGLHLEREVSELSKIIDNPKRPLAVLIGGAKIETKLPLVEKMHRVSDYVLVGGEIAEQDRTLIKIQHEKIEGHKSIVLVSETNDAGSDITPKSVENFKQILGLANTIVWNGPVGVITPQIQNSKFSPRGEASKIQNSEKGTFELAHFIVRTNAYKVVGGGDTLAFLRRIGLLSKFDFVSTGGGAMLEFLSGHKLAGLEALEK